MMNNVKKFSLLMLVSCFMTSVIFSQQNPHSNGGGDDRTVPLLPLEPVPDYNGEQIFQLDWFMIKVSTWIDDYPMLCDANLEFNKNAAKASFHMWGPSLTSSQLITATEAMDRADAMYEEHDDKYLSNQAHQDLFNQADTIYLDWDNTHYPWSISNPKTYVHTTHCALTGWIYAQLLNDVLQSMSDHCNSADKVAFEYELVKGFIDGMLDPPPSF